MAVSKALQFEVQKQLAKDDFGDEVEEGFFMKDLGVVGDTTPDENPHQAEPLSTGRTPLQRVRREMIPLQMVEEMMRYYMQPAVLNDMTILNPIRDGIPQCTRHPFVRGDSNKIGCIYGCGPRERDSAGNLPVARDYTVQDVYEWVKALVFDAAKRQDKRLGYMKPIEV